MEKFEKLIKPFEPITVHEGEKLSVELLGRKYTFGKVLFDSIVADNEELLTAPIRVTGSESGTPIAFTVFDSFIFERCEEYVIVCQSFQSDEFIVNTSIKLEFDGFAQIDFKIMPRGLTVAECFGMAAKKQRLYRLDSLAVEIPLKRGNIGLYHVSPYCNICDDRQNVVIPLSQTAGSGELTEGHYFLPFRPLVWLGDDDRGLAFIAESDQYWQPSDLNKTIEISDSADTRTLKLHLLDSHPESWVCGERQSPMNIYHPITYRFALQATPVKPFPKQPFLHNALHIDCFKKLSCDYKEFMEKPEIDDNATVIEGESGYDRIKRLGVTTLILHEKWNKAQNFPYLSEPTAKQLKIIVHECHKRGIKVIPYFGYEIATMSPLWGERSEEALVREANGNHSGGWWRVPPQRDYMVCYNSTWQDTFADGIKNLIEKYRFDGVYLDGTTIPHPCANPLHGCGYVGTDGKRHVTYPYFAVRKLLRRLYATLEPLGAVINYHTNACNPSVDSFTHISWRGEGIQFRLLNEGAKEAPLSYLRSEYCGQHFGNRVEMLAYENRPLWTFEKATAFSVLFGILPRPNDIGYPLEFISRIWQIFNRFPIEKSEWHPYYGENAMESSSPNIKISYWEYIDIAGQPHRLILAANIVNEPIQAVTVTDGQYLFGTATENNGKYDFSEFGFVIISA